VSSATDVDYNKRLINKEGPEDKNGGNAGHALPCPSVGRLYTHTGLIHEFTLHSWEAGMHFFVCVVMIVAHEPFLQPGTRSLSSKHAYVRQCMAPAHPSPAHGCTWLKIGSAFDCVTALEYKKQCLLLKQRGVHKQVRKQVRKQVHEQVRQQVLKQVCKRCPPKEHLIGITCHSHV
jgi:hypothetical protein